MLFHPDYPIISVLQNLIEQFVRADPILDIALRLVLGY
jgi:hypothetical protein